MKIGYARVSKADGSQDHNLQLDALKAQVRLAQAAIAKPETVVRELAEELGVMTPTLYRYVSPKGELRAQVRAVLGC